MGDFREQQKEPPSHRASGPKMGRITAADCSFDTLLARAKEGDQTAIGAIYDRFLPIVYRYTLARVADIPTAEDLTSETFMAMINSINSTRAEDDLAFVSWLLGIARNHVLMHFRRQKVHPEVGLQPQWWNDSQSVAEEDDPLLVLLARERWNETVSALGQLTPEQREVVVRRCVMGDSTEHVAQAMQRQTGTIRALQFRALATLSRLLNANGAAEKPQRRRNHA